MTNVIHIRTRRPVDPVSGAAPRSGECLACFIVRMVPEGECSGTFGWIDHYRAVRARRAVALTRRLAAQGAGCDCSVVSTVWQPSIALWSRDPASGELEQPTQLPVCAGVRPGSTQPCTLWVPAASLAL